MSDVAGEPAGDETTGSHQTDRLDIAGIPWMHDRLAHSASAAGPPAASVRSSPPEEPRAAEDGPMRVRDVWRAARARRRALRREVRRFTGRARRRRIVWSVTATAVVVLVVGSVGAAYSPLFAVERVSVVGASTLPAETLEEALAGQVGRPLPLVDASEVKAALVAFPLVESYTLEAQPPHELVVRIVERTPIGVLETAAGWTLVDAAGVVLSTTPDVPEGRPVLEVSGGRGGDAFESVGLVMRALPADIRERVTRVRATTRDDVTLTLGGTATDVVWGAVDETPLKALVLETAMQARPPEDVRVYDVSSPDAIIIS
ncbi:FtsQ-type POTRA domain-containing protein [Microbacterium sp. LRZ72]|uniref:FtsQ-type POTRA domain-containing protein n=1 Tax=Microbacterium sp. LRZ72 TaxID=2942481 RepID=UPI0029BFE91F|nr:FtsQ-type POTRA domain-containing protein [Microbacterium sp. LRZ72]